MEKKYLLALDEGTTSCRAVLYSAYDMRVLASAGENLNTYFPNSGWVEQDAEEIYDKLLSCIRRVLEERNISAKEIAAIGVTNQREAVVVWDRVTGKVLTPCISWQCRRTAEVCECLRKDVTTAGLIKDKTGLVVDAYFSATKLRWLLKNVATLKERAEKGEVCAGTVDSYVIYRLTNGKVHATDVTNASRTMLFNIHSMQWDDELLKLFEIPKSILPEVKECTANFGKTDLGGVSIPITGVAGDQQASLIGQACFEKGDVKCTYGTGAFILSNIGSKPIISQTPLITTVAYSICGQKAYAFEGSVFNCGTVIDWLISTGYIEKAEDSEVYARQVDNSGGVYFIPAFTGMGAPYWNMNCRAAILGITRGTTKSHIIRAAIESIALRCGEVCELMSEALGAKLGELRADGGVSRNGLLLELEADLLARPVHMSDEAESTALGAAYLAGIGCGLFDSTETIRKMHIKHKTVTPMKSPAQVAELKAGWKKAVYTIIG